MITKVAPCPCTSVQQFQVKCGVGQTGKDKPICPIPWHTRERGAQAQDAMFGKGMRLHNVRVKDGKVKGLTCTVCGTRKGEQ